MIQSKHTEIGKQALELLFGLPGEPDDKGAPDPCIRDDPSNAVDHARCRPGRPRASHRFQNSWIRMLQGNVDVVSNVARTTNHLKDFLSHQSGVEIQHPQNSDPRQLIEITKESCKLWTMFGSQIHAIGTCVLRNKDEFSRTSLYQLFRLTQNRVGGATNERPLDPGYCTVGTPLRAPIRYLEVGIGTAPTQKAWRLERPHGIQVDRSLDSWRWNLLQQTLPERFLVHRVYSHDGVQSWMSLQDLLPPQLCIAPYRHNSYNMPFSLQVLHGIERLVSLITSHSQEATRVNDDNISILRLGTNQSRWFCRHDLPKHCLAVSQVLCAPEADHTNSRPTVYAPVNHTRLS